MIRASLFFALRWPCALPSNGRITTPMTTTVQVTTTTDLATSRSQATSTAVFGGRRQSTSLLKTEKRSPSGSRETAASTVMEEVTRTREGVRAGGSSSLAAGGNSPKPISRTKDVHQLLSRKIGVEGKAEVWVLLWGS